MATTYPGTTSRFRPSVLKSQGAGFTPSSVQSSLDKWILPYYRDWLAERDRTGIGITTKLRMSTIAPKGPHQYDWALIDRVLAMDFFKNPIASFHTGIYLEATAWPDWVPKHWLGWDRHHKKQSVRLVVPDARDWILEFHRAFAKRYNDHPAVYTIIWQELAKPPGDDLGEYQQVKKSLIYQIADACSNMITALVHGPQDADQYAQSRFGLWLADPKLGGDNCEHGNFPPSGDIGWMHQAMNDYSVVIPKPAGGVNRPSYWGAESNGFRIAGGGYNLPNPWGLPFPDKAPHSKNSKLSLPIWAWYAGYNAHQHDVPNGVVPCSYLIWSGGGPRHEGITPKHLDEALRQFGAFGEAMCPALPWNWHDWIEAEPEEPTEPEEPDDPEQPGDPDDPDQPKIPDDVDARLVLKTDYKKPKVADNYPRWVRLDQPNKAAKGLHEIVKYDHINYEMVTVNFAGKGVKYRTEYLESPRKKYPGLERWYGLRVLIPKGFKTGPGRCVFLQNHGKDPNSQHWELSVSGGRFKSILYSGPNEQHKYIDDLGEVIFGEPTDFLIHAHYLPNAKGLYEVHRNGVRMVKRNPASGIGSTNCKRMIIQIGAYCPGWTNGGDGGASPLALLHTRFRIAEGPDGYLLADPGGDGGPDEPEEPEEPEVPEVPEDPEQPTEPDDTAMSTLVEVIDRTDELLYKLHGQIDSAAVEIEKITERLGEHFEAED